MTIEFTRASAFVADLGLMARPPVYLGHTRLETQPTSVGLMAGLQAPLADPLWLLARQWQFNEFQGEDAGTPIRLRFAVRGTRVDRFRSGPAAAASFEPIGELPIETRVEAEPVWQRHPRLAGEAGLRLLRRVPSAAIRTALLAAYPMNLEAPTDPQADPAGVVWSTLLHGRTLDGAALRLDLLPLWAGSALAGLPAALAAVAAVAADEAILRPLLEDWMGWLEALVVEGPPVNPSWRPDRLEYAFALSDGDVALTAQEYTDGHVDWDDFVAAPLPPGEAAEVSGMEFAVTQRMPTTVRYPGMPAERYWEFEDGQVSFAGAEAGVTDLLRMSVTEFALTFGNDWFLAPVRLPVGGLYRVEHLEITDTFGIPTSPGPLGAVGPAPWSLYDISRDPALMDRLDHTLFLPDSLDGVQEGAVLEQTFLARDEMANLAWAIEKTVQGVSGEPLDREDEARALAFDQRIDFDTAPDSPQLVYRLATPVPANWIPLLPVRRTPLPLDPADPLEIQLERAGMKRFYPEASVAVIGRVDEEYEAFLALLEAQTHFISRTPLQPGDDADLRVYVFHPRGWLLRSNPTQPMPRDDLLILEEEEVPRIGATLRRKFQYARGSDGRSWLWIGRSKLAGRGEASSGLRHDVAEKTTTLR
jgi:hypothetical protein